MPALKYKYVPITSEIILGTGMVLREIATNRLFTIEERVKRSQEVSGEDIWRIEPMDTVTFDRMPLDLPRQELAEKYFAEVEE